MITVCIVRLSALGDVLMLVPLVRALQDTKHYRITWVISRPAYDLVANLDDVEFIVIEKPRNFLDLLSIRKIFKQRSFDVLLATQASFSANILYPLIKSQRKIGYDSFRAKDGHWLFVRETIMPGNDHTLDGFLKFAYMLGVQKPISPRWDLPLASQDLLWAQQYTATLGSTFIIVNPAASKLERSWLPERYVQLIKALQKRFTLPIVLTGGPGDYDRNLANQILSHVHCFDLVGKTNLQQLLALISYAQLVICPDTGPSHMATAVETPVIALHAVTSAAVSGPYHCQHLAVDCYDIAVSEILGKSSAPWGMHIHGKQTMNLITVAQILQKIDEFCLIYK